MIIIGHSPILISPDKIQHNTSNVKDKFTWVSGFDITTRDSYFTILIIRDYC